MGGLGLGLTQHGAGHAQVLDEEDLLLETPHEVLAPPGESLDPPADQGIRELLRFERARPAGVEDLHAQQAVTLHEWGQLATDCLDLGKLGQGAPAYVSNAARGGGP
jgi:hypothetical protein